MTVDKIVSGGQTGVDRAALDAALERGLCRGGWCPRGRWAEDGPIAPGYPLVETPDAEPAQRTDWNARDSDATLILARGALQGGTAFTLERARHHGRPVLVVDLRAGADSGAVRSWIEQCGARVLNVAGPRESKAPGIYREALAFLRTVLAGSPGGTAPSASSESG